MTIQQINKIRSFGVFEKFDWDSTLPCFSTFNIFYGWNYSGKTTLSRILRTFETQQKHVDYPLSTFELQHKDGKKYSESTLSSGFSIRVFNSDFVNENFKWTENKDEIEPILLLGQQNIKIQDELNVEKQNLIIQEKEKNDLGSKKVFEENKIQNGLTDKGKEIKNALSIPNFNKITFEPIVIEASASVGKVQLAADDFRNLINVFRSTDKKEQLNPINIVTPRISQVKSIASTLLKTTVKSKVIERLKNDPSLNEWVKKGKDLHINKNTCDFCGGTLPTDLIEDLNNHFSKDYDNLITDLSLEIVQIEGKKLLLRLPDTALFYTEFQKDFISFKENLEKECQNFNTTLSSIKKLLEDKKLTVFEEANCPDFQDNADYINTQLKGINELITKHNLKTSDFQKEKGEALKKVLFDYALRFSNEIKYKETKKLITDYDSKINALSNAIQKTKAKVLSLEKQLSETVKGAEKINEYLFQYFGKNDIQVAVSSNKRFQLQRNTVLARNLSEGEKTAIAFAYFITSLEDKNTTLSNTIVYIDDPISSLDSNHLFNTYSFIKDKFYYYDEVAKKHTCKASQFFISTHNFEFFNLLKDWLKKVKNADKAFFLIERITNNLKDESVIKQLPNQLLTFKSEYIYLFFIIYSFHSKPGTDFNQLYNLPNVVRRFIETFSAFKYLSSQNIDENLDRLINDNIKAERVRKFVHYYSHSINTAKLLQLFDPTECTAVVEILLNAIKTVDLEHYTSLLNEVKFFNSVHLPEVT